MFAVATFIATGEVDAVPVNWLRRHAATEHHMYFRRPDAYIPIPLDQLEAVLRSIRQGQVHRRPKKSAGTRKKAAQVRQVTLSVRSPSPAWVPDVTRASPPAAAASAAAGRPPTPSFALQEDEGVFLAGQEEDLELPEIFQSGRLTPDQVLFDDVDVDRLSTGHFGASRPLMSDDSDSDAMGEEFPLTLAIWRGRLIWWSWTWTGEAIGTTVLTARVRSASATRFFPLPPTRRFVD